MQAKAKNIGQSVGITLDEQIFVERGQIISHEDSCSPGLDVLAGEPFLVRKSPTHT